MLDTKRGTGIEPVTIRAAIERSTTELPARPNLLTLHYKCRITPYFGRSNCAVKRLRLNLDVVRQEMDSKNLPRSESRNSGSAAVRRLGDARYEARDRD